MISGAGSVTNLNGTLTLGGVNTYAGDTTIAAAGAVKVGVAGAIPSGSGKGNLAANGTFTITVVNANEFSLNGSTGNGDYVAATGTYTRSGAILRYNPAGAGSWVLINQGGSQGTSPHADSRDLEFLSNNTLLEADDGGIFELLNPINAAANTWTTFGNLDAFEIYSVAYDSTNGLIFTGMQDNGSPHQNASGSGVFTEQTGGDGQFQQVDNTSLRVGGAAGDVFGYSLSNNFSFFNRNRFDNTGAYATPATGIINAATNASPIVITSAGHGLQTGDLVTTFGVTGNTSANGFFKVTRIDANSFSLQNPSNNNNIAGSGLYTGSGTWTRQGRVTGAGGAASTPVVITSAGHRLHSASSLAG